MEIIEQIVRVPEQGTAHETPILLLHGAWRDASCFVDLAEALAALGYRSTAISLPGHGKSTMHKGEIGFYSIRDYVRILLAELKRSTPRPLVVGHGLGGLISARAAEELELPGVVLLSGIPPAGMRSALLRMMAKSPIWGLKQLFAWFRDPWSEKPELARRLFRGAGGGDVGTLLPESKTVFQELFFRTEVRAESLRARALVCSGSEDAIFTHAEQSELATSLGAEHLTFPGAPHDVMAKDSASEVAAAIHGWFSRDEASRRDPIAAT